MPAKKHKNKKGKKPGQNQWDDHLTLKARSEGYPARSVYKLMEIQNKFKVIRKNDRVLDLGCAPGSWLLYASDQVGRDGTVFGIDLQEVQIKLPENTKVIQDDILSMADTGFLTELKGLNGVISDMAPATTGRKDVDAARSFELCEVALTVADQYLSTGGSFICKIFQGGDFKVFEKNVKSRFRECKIFKPDSCRKQSKEIYIIAKGKK